MTNVQILYDARQIAGFHKETMMFGMMAFAFGSFVVYQAPRSKPPRQGSDPAVRRAGGLAMALIGLVLFGSAVMAAAEALEARWTLARSQVAVVQGCVGRFERIVHHNDHDLTETDFELGGRSFHLTSSPWLAGFHDEYHSLGQGQGVRITLKGDKMLLVEQVPTVCRTASSS